ncbi:PREDICTED: origin recognition complex subunit 3 [Dinoponera quadriceps]|uniref:Origin recognition complex subunit 3 n=1 Tax=Dinoponera quadriceps TaxID=609295 RepID=A0A6P3Y9G0_DINQU|nr:PREDICTED: origin recognition complex subunit 3 [Dinoponera quadriceps]
MENVSVSKGVFAYKGNYKIGNKKKKKSNAQNPEYFDEPWYVAYSETWRYIEQAVENVRSRMFHEVMSNLGSFVLKAKTTPLNAKELATAILLTGVNVPDHTVLFDTTVSKLSKITPHIAVLWSRNCGNVKSIIEDTVYQLVNATESEDVVEVPKNRCTMRVLKEQVGKHYNTEDPLVVILPDFESFSTSVLHDFILVLSSYTSTLKFVLIFGVATTLHVVHRSLTYDVTSKLAVQVFHTQTQVQTLSDILENTVFSTEIPFKLIGRAFQLLTDIFLFYDFSVDRFMQNYKICMIQHFYGNNISSLCCHPRDIKKRISKLTDENIADIKSLPSIARYLKTSSKSANQDDNGDKKFKELLEKLLNKFHEFMHQFLIILRCMHCLFASLPGAPMGKQLREVYTKAVYTSNLTDSVVYKECLKLLGFLSKEELLSKLESVVKIVDDSADPTIKNIKSELETHIETIREASLDAAKASSELVTVNDKLNRLQLKEKLLKMSQQQSQSAYKQAQHDLIDYLDRRVFSVHLVDPSCVTAHEIFCYSDGNQAKHHIRGSLRAAIHTGLSDPQIYLDCDCCKLENDDDIPRTLPDLSIIYKLHLESGKLINMYDWLQAFLTIVDPQQQGAQRDVDLGMQARFTQAVAALQFLGFIKTSRSKTDHVKRLT